CLWVYDWCVLLFSLFPVFFVLTVPRHPRPTLFPYTTLFRSSESRAVRRGPRGAGGGGRLPARPERRGQDDDAQGRRRAGGRDGRGDPVPGAVARRAPNP